MNLLSFQRVMDVFLNSIARLTGLSWSIYG